MIVKDGYNIIEILDKYPEYGITECGQLYSFKRGRVLTPQYIIGVSKVYLIKYNMVRVLINIDEYQTEETREKFVSRMKELNKINMLGYLHYKDRPEKGYICIYNSLGEVNRKEFFNGRAMFLKRIAKAFKDTKKLSGHYIQTEYIYD